ncbi:dTDP-glucose 4,6-dehydratase [Helicobacter winghamensis]|uniref:dTDP-glucose 4,6-dehydratase n=1 Tax=Helicobacter winghamensis TaxID=157268 RepID=UPI0018A5DD9B|nr:dTDP-glucose 4,6-dehydratase [Helicobacter winghamensis]QOQ98038.1 dTDP-glucose 4,6-dehydratase [Helicobacter winghamensis]
MDFQRNILITGGAGFIGSHLVRFFVKKYPKYRIVNLDKLTYAGNLANLLEIKKKQNYIFEYADICDIKSVRSIFEKYKIDGVIHLAAESHVDRSIDEPFAFAKTNILGTLSLLQTSYEFWKNLNILRGGGIFYHISTDEVYGTLKFDNTLFTENTKYDPHSPYSASKASSDHFVRAFYDTYGLPILITNCSNNYGPFQFPEKLIPVAISNLLNGESIPIYGKGENVRDWLYVEDHVRAIDLVFHCGKIGETYNIGGNNERKNIDIIFLITRIIDELLENPIGTSEKLISFVEDRAGHDLRYAIDASKIREELGWMPLVELEEGIKRTAMWYLENRQWLAVALSKKLVNCC